MVQIQTFQTSPSMMGNYNPNSADQTTEKKSGWFKWLIIVLVILIVVGGLAWWIFTP